MNWQKKYGDGPIPLKVIAKDNGLSEHYLEQLAALLRNAGLIKSVRGAYGGYKLTKEPKHIHAGDIIRALEGPIVLVEGLENEPPAQQALWLKIRDAVREVLEKTTLEDLVQYNQNEKEPPEAYMFYI